MQSPTLTPYWFTPKSEKKKNNPTRFKITPLTASRMYEVLDDCESINGDPRPKKAAREILWEDGIVDWENLKQDKITVPFTSNNFDAIPFIWLTELTNEIFVKSTLSGKEIKN